MPQVVQISGGSTVVVKTGGVKTVEKGAGSTVVARDNRGSPIGVIDRRPTIETGSNIGRRGEKGEPGDGTFQATAGETIHGDRAVRIRDGLLYHPDPETPSHANEVIGIAMTSGLAGDQITVRTSGNVTQAFWTWTPGFVFVGPAGQLTQSPSPTGWLLEIGRARTATVVEIDIEVPVFRAP